MKKSANFEGGLVFTLVLFAIAMYYIWFLIGPIVLGYYVCKLIYATSSVTNNSLNATIARVALQAVSKANHIEKLANDIRLDPEKAYFEHGDAIVYPVQNNITVRPPRPDFSGCTTQQERDVIYADWKKADNEYEMRRKIHFVKINSELDNFYREIKY